MKRYTLFIPLIGVFLLVFFLVQGNRNAVSFPVEKKDDSSATAPKDEIRELLHSMPLEEKVGQMFMLGIFAENIERWKEEFLIERNIGGVILHPYNVKDAEQISRFIASLQEGVNHKNIPLLIAVNQEGGDQSILGGEIVTLRFAKERRGGRVVADEETAFEVAFARAKELKELGINVNFAPVLDVVEEPNSFLYTRSFSGVPEKVSSLARAYIKGQREGGVISTGKHFPGHGISLGDSHINMPISSATREELNVHLVPFQAAIEEGIEMIMATHMVFPMLDKENVLFSKVFMKDILRDELGFKGVIITDDLEMKAARNTHSMQKAVLKAVQAGVDMVIISGIEEDQKRGFDTLIEAVRSGTIPEERIDESVERILLLKSHLLTNQ